MFRPHGRAAPRRTPATRASPRPRHADTAGRLSWLPRSPPWRTWPRAGPSAPQDRAAARHGLHAFRDETVIREGVLERDAGGAEDQVGERLPADRPAVVLGAEDVEPLLHPDDRTRAQELVDLLPGSSVATQHANQNRVVELLSSDSSLKLRDIHSLSLNEFHSIHPAS